MPKRAFTRPDEHVLELSQKDIWLITSQHAKRWPYECSAHVQLMGQEISTEEALSGQTWVITAAQLPHSCMSQRFTAPGVMIGSVPAVMQRETGSPLSQDARSIMFQMLGFV